MEAVHHHSQHHDAHEGIFKKYMFSTDHKIIGLQYLWTGLFMALVGGFFAYVFRMQLAFPGSSVPLFGVVDPLTYNILVTNHGAIMIFWVGMPALVAAFGNLLIPLMIGCDDMVFPRLNRLSYQFFLLSVILLLASFFVPQGGFNGAWTIYPPLATKIGPAGSGEWGGTLFILAVAVEFAAFLMGGINFLTTTMNARAKGMSLYDLPMVVWMINLASLVFMLSVGPLIAGAVMLLGDRVLGTGFYNPTMGGDPVLFQHLFWFFGHPEVYVLLLPAMGIVAEVITCHSRKTLFGYKMILWSAIATGSLSFIVWAHHQFVAGIDPRMATYFSIATIIISIPVAIALFAFIATLYKGSIVFNSAMLFGLGWIFEFLIGGITGIHLASTAADIYFHDNYFVVAHFHYTMVPLVFYGTFTGLYHWYPKFTGRKMDETLGKLHFWGTTIFFNMIFIPLFYNGFMGQHRRIADYKIFTDLNGLQPVRVLATMALLGLLASQVPLIINFIRSYKKGDIAGDNPWNGTTLEWACPSPPPHGNFAKEVTVYRGPYEYSVPGAKQDFIMQNSPK
ncbi:MAG: cbb3-type cytochrome c oxidase subunit I [Deltaproteobacteria bacterium]|nr:cbb3-type cytochrome c oxidase subunit I [Deltaproteobacteria bacterium]